MTTSPCSPRLTSRLPRWSPWTAILTLAVTVLLAALETSTAHAGCIEAGSATTSEARASTRSTPGTADLAAQLMRLPAEEFEAIRNAPDRAVGFDWSTDGCSWTPSRWEARFLQACHLHDFGYRNYGKGLRLGPDEATRKWIDGRFRAEMLRICDRDYVARRAMRLLCRTEARAMYLAVRVANHWS